MRLLLDTNALIFTLEGDPRLSAAAARALQDEAEESFVSRVSLWEISTKRSTGKWDMDVSQALRGMRLAGLRPLAIQDTHILAYQDLPRLPRHRDPFDRMLVAQAKHEGLTLLTRDSALAEYGIPILAT